MFPVLQALEPQPDLVGNKVLDVLLRGLGLHNDSFYAFEGSREYFTGLTGEQEVQRAFRPRLKLREKLDKILKIRVSALIECVKDNISATNF
jgi:hypothetical protein